MVRRIVKGLVFRAGVVLGVASLMFCAFTALAILACSFGVRT